MKSLETLADRFFHVFCQNEWSGGSEVALSALSVAEVYKVQTLVAQKRIEAGETVAGFKVGCTSEAIRTQFGLAEPISARLFHPHIFEENIGMDWSDYVNCAIEPEFVLKISKDLQGADLSDAVLIEAIEYVSPGLEIHNFKFWQSPPTVQELICSGGIHAGLVVGSTRVSPHNLHFGNELFSVFKDEQLITSAPATEIMGGPLHSLRWLVNFLTTSGSGLTKDSLVLPGSPVELVRIDCDSRIKVEIDRVGSLTVSFIRK